MVSPGKMCASVGLTSSIIRGCGIVPLGDDPIIVHQPHAGVRNARVLGEVEEEGEFAGRVRRRLLNIGRQGV